MASGTGSFLSVPGRLRPVSVVSRPEWIKVRCLLPGAERAARAGPGGGGICTHTHTHLCTHAHMHTCTYTCTHTHTHTHIHTHTHTRVHTHTQMPERGFLKPLTHRHKTLHFFQMKSSCSVLKVYSLKREVRNLYPSLLCFMWA